MKKFILQIKSNKNKCLYVFMSCLFLTLFLASCGGNSHQARVRQQVEEIKRQLPKPIADLPLIKPLAKEKYQAANLRSPFYRPAPAVPQGERPDVSRPKEPLEEFALDSLKMVGTIEQNSKDWVLILTPQGTVFPVTLGNYIGQNYGRITNITSKEVELLESIQMSGQWQKRTAVISLTDK